MSKKSTFYPQKKILGNQIQIAKGMFRTTSKDGVINFKTKKV